MVGVFDKLLSEVEEDVSSAEVQLAPAINFEIYVKEEKVLVFSSFFFTASPSRLCHFIETRG